MTVMYLDSQALGDIVEPMCKLFDRFAIKSDVVPGKYGTNVRVRYGKGKHEGQVLFTFMTEDKLVIDVPIVVQELMMRQKEYINGVLEDVSRALMGARKEFQERSAIVIPETSDVTKAVSDLLSKKAFH